MSTTAELSDEIDARPAQPGSTPQRPRHWRRIMRRDGKEWILFSLLVLPNLAVIVTFNYWPVIQNFYLSLTSWDFVAVLPTFVGAENYLDLLGDSEFHQVLINSLIYATSIVAATMIIGLALGLLFNQRLKGSSVARFVSFAPHIITGSALATLWLFILDPRYGLLSGLLGPLGVSTPDWTHSSTWSLWSIISLQVWNRVGFTAIIFLAALQGMPKDVYEAATLDGAGTWARFRRITLPLLSPITLFLLIITTLHSFRAYEATALMTGGGPGISSTTLTWYIYQLAFSNYDVGHATAAAVLLFFILIAISIAQFAVGRKRVHYQ